MQYEEVLPDNRTLRCDGIQIADGQITITVSSRSPVSFCPVCGTPSQRVHSRYRRTLADLPWHGSRVRLLWNSRRLFCDQADGPRRIFTERLPEVAAPYARGTRRLTSTLAYLGLACGAAAGSRLAARLGM